MSAWGHKRTNQFAPIFSRCPLLSKSGQRRVRLDCPLSAAFLRLVNLRGARQPRIWKDPRESARVSGVLHITLSDAQNEWKDIETGEPLKSCAMIITNANELASKVHDRMPVLLSPDEFEPWLSGHAGT